MSLPGKQETSKITPHRKFKGHTDTINGIIHPPGGQRVMTCSADGSLRVWNLESGLQIGHDWRDGDRAVFTMALSPDGTKVVTGSGDNVVRLWDIKTGKIVTKWKQRELGGIRTLCWSRDGGRVLSGASDGTFREWDVKSGKHTMGPIRSGHSWVAAVVYSPDMTMIATGGYSADDRYIEIWDAETGEQVNAPKGNAGTALCLAWTADGKTLISGSSNYSIMTWNTAAWKETAVLRGHTNVVNDIAISPINGCILASTSADNTARLWNIEDEQCIGLLAQHTATQFTQNLSFSTDGKLLATGCDDFNALHTWDVSSFLRGPGSNNLLSDPNAGDKSLVLEADATRRPVQRPEQVPKGFFDDVQEITRAQSSPKRLPPSSARQDLSSTPDVPTFFGRFSSLFRRIHSGAHHTLTQYRPPVVSVPYTRGKRRNVSAAEVRIKKAKELKNGSPRPLNIMTIPSPSNGATQSQPLSQEQAAIPMLPITPAEATQSQPSSQPQTAAPVLPTIPAVASIPAAATSITSLPHVTIRRAGWWTRFWLLICCTSAEYNDGRH